MRCRQDHSYAVSSHCCRMLPQAPDEPRNGASRKDAGADSRYLRANGRLDPGAADLFISSPTYLTLLPDPCSQWDS